MNLLSIDWDYFFFDRTGYGDRDALYDWGHREAPMFIETLWDYRAAGFLRRGLPLPMTTGDEAYFWSRRNLQIVKDAPLYVGESHLFAVDQRIYDAMAWDTEPPVIWSFDAHHDLGYHTDAVKDVIAGKIECGSWLLWYGLMLDAEIHVRYPRWHTDWHALDPMWTDLAAMPFRFDRKLTPTNERMPEFDAIFLCRSGAWTPSWLDDRFFAFLTDAPTSTIITVGEDVYPLEGREFDLALAQRLALSMQQVTAGLDETT